MPTSSQPHTRPRTPIPTLTGPTAKALKCLQALTVEVVLKVFRGTGRKRATLCVTPRARDRIIPH